MYVIYHNPRCRHSRIVLERLRETAEEIQVVDYMSVKLKEKELKKLLIELQMTPQELIRKNEELYKKEYKGKTFSEEEWIHILCKNPRLIERPIVKKGYRAYVCRPAEIVDQIINN